MCEIPNNVVLADEFAELFDGFSIGSNDLTQLTLGVDRDSELLAQLFDERDPGVKALIAQVIGGRARQAAQRSACAARRRATIPRSPSGSPSRESTRSRSTRTRCQRWRGCWPLLRPNPHRGDLVLGATRLRIALRTDQAVRVRLGEVKR